MARFTRAIFAKGEPAPDPRRSGLRRRFVTVSDKSKFCNDLNGPKTPKMSERPLKTPQDFPTSKLNTRVRFLSPAPVFPMLLQPASAAIRAGLREIGGHSLAAVGMLRSDKASEREHP
jgi:hypothetical protein